MNSFWFVFDVQRLRNLDKYPINNRDNLLWIITSNRAEENISLLKAIEAQQDEYELMDLYLDQETSG